MTRKEYMDKMSELRSAPAAERDVIHHQYWGQFVTPSVKSWVVNGIGVNKIMRSKDPINFNDIPLALWDRIVPAVKEYICAVNKKVIGSYEWSTSDCVCALKEAAWIIREENLSTWVEPNPPKVEELS